MGAGHGSHSAASVAAGAVDEPFLSVLDPDAAEELARRGVVRTFARGQALFHEGQLADRVLILRRGRVKVTATTSNGREVVLAFRGPGELLGEQSALDGQPRSSTICAVDRVEALSLGVADFRAFLVSHPEIALRLLGVLSRRLRDADAKRIEFSAFTTIERVAARLLELSDRFGRDEAEGIRIGLPLSQEELAGATGASIESVGRALQTMRALKCIQTGRREIRITDRDVLEALRRDAR